MEDALVLLNLLEIPAKLKDVRMNALEMEFAQMEFASVIVDFLENSAIKEVWYMDSVRMIYVNVIQDGSEMVVM